MLVSRESSPPHRYSMTLSQNTSAVESLEVKDVVAALSSKPLKANSAPRLHVRIISRWSHTVLKHYHRLDKIKAKTQGYHFGFLFCAVSSGIVFLNNLIVTIWAVRIYDIAGGLGTIQDGSCSTTNNLSTWLHLAVNVFSTLLIGCSNYTMQCLASPTRKEIDKAHSQKRWLDIGVPSTRNLLLISRWRVVLWCLVALSSVPLHLLYNSTIQ